MTVIALIFFVSGLLQGITSFGFSLIALPLLSFQLDLQLIVPVLIIYSLVMNSTILLYLYKHVKVREIILIAFAGIIFTPIGMQILLFMDGNLLKMITGFFIFLFSIMLMLNKHYEIKNEKAGKLLTGALSGILNGSVSFSGPPLIIFMSNKGMEKQQFRANLTFYFWVLNIITIPTFFFGGLITSQTLVFSAKYVLFLIIGVMAGVFLGNRLKESYFKKMVIVILMILGIVSFVTSLNLY
ncbi:MAG: sulfite exporter TauE/SafE family protein [Clostridiales bacterium]|nr:sulfite exporter TauE/SafE family protein [Clostridiales bacterium]